MIREISDGVNCCTPKGQLRRYLNCVGCDQKPEPKPLERVAAELSLKFHNFGQHDLAEDIYIEAFIKGYNNRQGDINAWKQYAEDWKKRAVELESINAELIKQNGDMELALKNL
jgi:hypothetical protein